jgi:SAM-dependent methyltransferase
LFDFGCGSGAHACFFASQGITVYGVDANEDAVSKCKALLPHWKDNFKAVSPKPDGKPYFDGLECDAVIGNQVLYYLDDEDLEKALGALHRTLKVGGVFIATMMSRHHDYFDGSEPAGKGLRLVSRARAISRSTPARFYINFTESEDALAAKFNIFQKEHVGYYDAVIREDLGSSHHYIFVGTKT